MNGINFRCHLSLKSRERPENKVRQHEAKIWTFCCRSPPLFCCSGFIRNALITIEACSALSGACGQDAQQQGDPFLICCLKVWLPAFFFLVQFDTLISNIVPFFSKFGKNDVAVRLNVNLGSFRHTVRSSFSQVIQSSDESKMPLI